jgi:hypothetical protein
VIKRGPLVIETQQQPTSGRSSAHLCFLFYKKTKRPPI